MNSQKLPFMILNICRKRLVTMAIGFFTFCFGFMYFREFSFIVNNNFREIK